MVSGPGHRSSATPHRWQTCVWTWSWNGPLRASGADGSGSPFPSGARAIWRLRAPWRRRPIRSGRVAVGRSSRAPRPRAAGTRSLRDQGRNPLLVLLLLAVVPVAAEARTIKLDGVVTGPPTASRGAVTVPFELTTRAGRAVNLGTRRVFVRLRPRARLRLSGAGATGASRLSPRGLIAGDRVKGVTSLSRRARRRLRWHARPELNLKRARVIRPAPPVPGPPRALGLPAGGAPAGGSSGGGSPGGGSPGGSAPPSPSTELLGQIVAHLQAETTELAARAAEPAPLPQKIDAQRPRLESLKTGLEGVTIAFDSLKTALEGLEGSVDQAALLAEVEALRAPGGGARERHRRDRFHARRARRRGEQGQERRGEAGSHGREPRAASCRCSSRPRAPRSWSARSTAPRAPSTAGSPRPRPGSSPSPTARTRSLPSWSPWRRASRGWRAPPSRAPTSRPWAAVWPRLGAAVAGLESGFGGLQATTSALVPTAEAIETEAPGLETSVGGLCSLVPTTCP